MSVWGLAALATLVFIRGWLWVAERYVDAHLELEE